MRREAVQILATWLALLALLALTVAALALAPGLLRTLFGYGVASAKAALVVWIFMEMRRETPVARFATIAAALWLLMMLALTAADYMTRALAGT